MKPGAFFRAQVLPFRNSPRSWQAGYKSLAIGVTPPATLIASPYNLDAYLRETNAPPDYAVLAHAGHGINSYAIHCFLVVGRLRIFLQLTWGGVYEDNAPRARAIETCFALVDTLVETYDNAGAQDPTLTVAGSSFCGSFVTVGSGANPDRLDPSSRPHDALAAALRADSRNL